MRGAALVAALITLGVAVVCAAAPRKSQDWVLVSSTLQLDNDLYLVHPDGRAVVLLTPNDGYTSDTSPVVSRDGRTIAFARDNSLYVMRTNGHDQRDLDVYADEYALSPDGSRIAFTDAPFLWVSPTVGGEPEAILGGVPELTDISWSPRGTWIGFRRYGDQATGAYEIVRSDGSDLHTVLVSDHFSRPQWSPDERKIAYSRGDGGSLLVLDLDAREEHVLAEGAYPLEWSPDGKRLAFARDRGSGVYTIRADGTGVHLAARVRPWRGYGAVWSHDGGTIALPILDRGCARLVVVAATGGPARSVGTGATCDNASEFFGGWLKLSGATRGE